MPPRPAAIGDLSNDDYVAQVLANEARDNSKNYALEGLGAYMPKKLSGAAPKPNTRFLRHIIRETDNHNTALKRKEEREARERMRQLREQQAASSASRDTRRPRGDRESGGRGGERERRDDREREHRRRRRRSRSASEDRDRDRSRRHRRGHESEYERSKYRRRDRDDDERDYSRRHRSHSRSRSRSPRDERERDSRSGRRRHGRSYHSRSPERSKKEYKEDGGSRDGHRGSHEHRSTQRSGQYSRRLSPPPTNDRDQASDHDSDPLEDLVGPLPQKDGTEAPMRSRGRGAYKASHSNIDAHFAKDYDPTLDVHLEDDDPSSGNVSTRRRVPGLMTEDDDWELALEALRDRTRWKQKGEERLRQAGFSESTVDRWKNNAAFTGRNTEGSIEDVKWSKKGEGREWDRGKVFDEDGHVDVRAPW